jgi:hypothetical protein
MNTDTVEYIVLHPFPELNKTISSSTPSSAAKKVYSKIIRPTLSSEEKNDQKKFSVFIKNKISGKEFKYEVNEQKKNDIVLRGNKEIPYTYTVIVKSMNINNKDKNSVTKKKKRNYNTPSPPHQFNISPYKKFFSKPKIKQTPPINPNVDNI